MPYVTPACAQFAPEQLQLSSGSPVGAGAISTVVQSTLRTSGLPIAVKVLSKIQLLQQQKVESAMNEKTALVNLAPHPYIARLYGTAQSEDELYFVMEWLPNGDLLQHIRRTVVERVKQYNNHNTDIKAEPASATTSSPTPSSQTTTTTTATEESALLPIPVSSTQPRCLPFRDVQLITAQLVLGLARVFEKGYVLRDLKPENIAFDDHYRAVLLDFDTVDLEGHVNAPVTNHGVALRPESEDAAHGQAVAATAAAAAATSSSSSSSAPPPKRRLTVSEIQSMRKKTSSFCGTAQYVSPEMVGECKWSFASDLWSLGTVVYEMLYGEHMFSGVNAYAVLKKVLKGAGVGEATASLVSFHPIDFSDDDTRGGEDAETSRAAARDGFERVKDFVLRLVDIDPLKRLGVNATTGTFDVDALKQHALFRDFDWRTVEAQLETFQTYDFTDATRTPFALAGSLHHDQGSRPSVDPSPSLKPHYTVVPHHDESYAAYVYKATADANPFERFLQQSLSPEVVETKAAAATTHDDDAPPKELSADSDSSSNSQSAPVAEGESNAAAVASATEQEPEPTEESDSDSLEIVDDVGMHYDGRPAPPEFRS